MRRKPTTTDNSCQPKLVDRLGRPVKHGMHDSPENLAWRHMLDRCYNPNSQRYDRYGARGIRVCAQWKNSFEAFFADMGNRPTPKHSLDRIENDGDYEPGNCRWATRAEQSRNRSDNVHLEFDGRSQTIAEWAREIGIGTKTLSCRLAAGWSVEESLTRSLERRPWNQAGPDPTSWKRNPRRVPLSSAAIAILKAMIGRGWLRPASILLDGRNAFFVLKGLAQRSLVDIEFMAPSSRSNCLKRHRRYRISEAGCQEIDDQIQREQRNRDLRGDGE